MSQYRLVGVGIFVVLVATGTVFGTVVGASVQDDDPDDIVITKQYDFRGGEIADTTLSVGDNTTVTVTIQSYNGWEADFPILLYENGNATTSVDVVELAPGESKTVELTYRAFDHGEFDITVNGTATEQHHHIGTITVEEPWWNQSTESESTTDSDQNEGLRIVQLFGAVLFATGALLFAAAPVLEGLRAIKYYSGDELTASMRPAIGLVMAGSVGLATGGHLIGGVAIVGSIVGGVVFAICAAGFGGYYGLKEAYRRI